MIGEARKIQGKQRDKIAEKYGWACWMCGSKENLEVHHKVPWQYQKNNDESNLVALCRKCHRILHRHNNNPSVDDMALLEARGIDGTVALPRRNQTKRKTQNISSKTPRKGLAAPYVGEVRYGWEIGRKPHNDQYIWWPCSFCLRTRWVRLVGGVGEVCAKPEFNRCARCGWRDPDSRLSFTGTPVPAIGMTKARAGRLGGLITLKRYGIEQLRRWGKLGGRPRGSGSAQNPETKGWTNYKRARDLVSVA